MAINLDDRYPGRAGPKSVSYPQGSFKDRTAPDAKDGTYLQQDWANDQLAFFQSLMVEAGLTANGNVDTVTASQYFDALQAVVLGLFPAGIIAPFAGPVGSVPDGYLLCDFSAISRTTYAKLFAAIGTTYGAGDGSTTFNVPDLRAEFIRGLDNGRGKDAARTLGSWQKGSVQTFDPDQAAPAVSGLWPNSDTNVRGLFGLDSVDPSAYPNTAVVFHARETETSALIQVAGGVVRPSNVAMNYIIKY